MKNRNVVVKKDCHSQKSLSGISTLDTKIVYRLGVSPTGAVSKPWNVCCLAGKLSGFHPTYKEEALNKGTFRAPLRSGFTLIELLVVVLIIGILAAVAVPQYQKAVEKSRAAKAKVVLRALGNASDFFQLANGREPNSAEELDLQLPAASYWEFYNDEISCDDDERCGVRWGAKSQKDTYRLFYVDHYYGGPEDRAHGKFFCEPQNEEGRKICAVLGMEIM